jgi:hypothetical protein
MSERLSFSSTKYGPSVSAAVTHDDEGVVVVGVVVPVVSLDAVPVTPSEAQPSNVCETMTVAAALAAIPNSRRRSTFTAAGESRSRFFIVYA